MVCFIRLKKHKVKWREMFVYTWDLSIVKLLMSSLSRYLSSLIIGYKIYISHVHCSIISVLYCRDATLLTHKSSIFGQYLFYVIYFFMYNQAIIHIEVGNYILASTKIHWNCKIALKYHLRVERRKKIKLWSTKIFLTYLVI